MKQGNQFYLELQIIDENNELLDVTGVSKVQFNLGELTKVYSSDSNDVTYNEDNKVFKIWLTEDETFLMRQTIKIDARILFKNDVILGSEIDSMYFYESLKQEKLDVQVEDI